jgi:hypothetical protein
MKKQIMLLVSIACISFTSGHSFSQCIPDTVTCKDILEPGQVCPEILPAGFVGQAYNHTVTIIPPSTFVFNDIPFIISKIEIDTITNLPPGLTYEVNAKEMYPDTAYCALLSGIPSQAGEFEISITIIPYIELFGSPFKLEPVQNDTSIKMFVFEPTIIRKVHSDEFGIIGSRPNPFTHSIQLGLFSDKSSQYKLNIYNNIGVLIYSETTNTSPGESFFRFTGENLIPGCYIYTISNEQTVFSDKLIKSR